MKVFLAYSEMDADFAREVEDHLRSNNIAIIAPDKDASPHERSVELAKADVCLALMGPQHERVLFEIGMAAGAGVPLLIIELPDAKVPEDLASFPYVSFRGQPAWDRHRLAVRLIEIERQLSEFSAWTGSRSNRFKPATMNALQFEQAVAHLLTKIGFKVERPEYPTGYDFLIKSPDGELAVVQVKSRGAGRPVSVETLRNVLSSKNLVNARYALIVTDGGFTASSRDFANQTEVLLRDVADLEAAKTPKDVLRF